MSVVMAGVERWKIGELMSDEMITRYGAGPQMRKTMEKRREKWTRNTH